MRQSEQVRCPSQNSPCSDWRLFPWLRVLLGSLSFPTLSPLVLLWWSDSCLVAFVMICLSLPGAWHLGESMLSCDLYIWHTASGPLTLGLQLEVCESEKQM